MKKMFVANKAFCMRPDGKVLFLRDTGKMPGHEGVAGNYDIPGGRMDEGETPREGLIRELKEEAGYSISPEKPELIYTNNWKINKTGETVVGMYYLVRVDDQDPVLSDEHDEVVWIDPKNSPKDFFLYDEFQEAFDVLKKHVGAIQLDERIKGRKGLGLIQVVTGDGKGKTTSALGQAVRAVGAGLKVAIVFFDKGGDSHYSERVTMNERFKGKIDYFVTGRDRIDPKTGRFDFSITDKDKSEGLRGIEFAQKALTNGEYNLVIMDEINSSADLGIVNELEILDLLKNKRDDIEVILTGRNAPESFKKEAHLVSEVKMKKHYFYSGVSARKGIDY